MPLSFLFWSAASLVRCGNESTPTPVVRSTLIFLSSAIAESCFLVRCCEVSRCRGSDFEVLRGVEVSGNQTLLARNRQRAGSRCCKDSVSHHPVLTRGQRAGLRVR